MLEKSQGIIAELDKHMFRKNPSDFLRAKDEKGEIVMRKPQPHCGSLRPGLIAVRKYISH